MRRFATIIALTGAAALALTGCGAAGYKVQTGAMLPTIKPGSMISVDEAYDSAAPKLYDIVVFHPPMGATDETCANPHEGFGEGRACDKAGQADTTQLFVKRVVGLPGDHLRFVNGVVYRNGAPETKVATVHCARTDARYCQFPATLVVPAGEYYLLSDNRPLADDSRAYGPIPRRSITGRVTNY